MSLHNDLYCGGSNAYIELIEDGISCETSHKVHFYRGAILSWSGSALGTCLGKDFNGAKDGLYFKVRSTSGDEFCPKSLTVSMDKGDLYERTGLNDWVDKTKGYQKRVAPRISGIDQGTKIIDTVPA